MMLHPTYFPDYLLKFQSNEIGCSEIGCRFFHKILYILFIVLRRQRRRCVSSEGNIKARSSRCMLVKAEQFQLKRVRTEESLAALKEDGEEVPLVHCPYINTILSFQALMNHSMLIIMAVYWRWSLCTLLWRKVEVWFFADFEQHYDMISGQKGKVLSSKPLNMIVSLPSST